VFLHSNRGRWDEAVEEAEKALKAAEESSNNSLVIFAVWTLSMAYTWRGDLNRGVEYGELALQKDDKARQTREEGLEIAERCGARYYIGWSHRFLGEIALKVNPAQAVSHFEKSIAVLQKIKAENELALAYAGYGRLKKQQGQFAPAREYLTKALQIFERLGTLIEPDKIREILAQLPAA
jgi:tetratricopeptide (TPR) repeat protein